MTRSIQTTANNSASTSITEVGTSTGFNAGDFVYYSGGDYKATSGLTLPSTATFNLTANLPVTPTGFALSYNSTGGTTTIGGGGNKSAAVLTNGNIVQVFISISNSQPYFQIVNSSYVSQVAATSMSATYTNTTYSNIGVLALTGGGFVAYWVNSAGGTANSMNYAIYTNAGALTTAATQDTSFALGVSYTQINGVGLANGGFVLSAVTNGGPNVVFRGYGATGTGTFSLVTLTPIVQNNSYWVGLAARSDSSFILVWPSAGPLVNYSLYSSAGANITSGNISLTNTNYACDVTTLSNGTTFVIGYVNYISSLYTPCFRLLPTGNVLGGQTTIPAANINGGQCTSGAYTISLLGLSNGNFVYTFGDAGNSSYPGLTYAVFDSTGTSATATNSTGTVPLPLNSIPLLNYSYINLIETSAAIVVHWNVVSKTTYLSYSTYYGNLSKTTYLPTAATTLSTVVGSASAAASGVGYANTTPTAVATAAASTGNALVSSSTSYILSPTLLYGTNTVIATASATHSDGKFVIAYKDATTYAVYASVFSSAGVLQTTISVATGYASTMVGGLGVAFLTSGKIVVSYYNSGGNITNSLYSTSYTLIASTTQTAYAGTSYQVGVAGLANDRFVVVYNNAASKYNVYDNTNTLIAGPTTIIAANCTGTSVCANNWGGFYVSFYYSGSSSSYIYSYYNSTGTTYASTGNYNVSTSGNYVLNNKPFFANGIVYAPSLQSSGTTPIVMFSDDSASYGSYSPTMSGTDVVSYGNIGIGCTGLGNPVVFYGGASTPSTALFSYTNKVPASFASSGAIQFPNVGTFALTGATFRGNNGWGTLPTVTPGIGNSAVVAWCNSSGYLYYAIVNATPVSSNLTTVAGVTSSTAIPVYPGATTSSTVIGATFTGVAASTAAAGGSGQVITNGPAKLNSNYTNTASGAFDHTGTAINGVKGTYNGNIVNMQGNT